MTKLGLGGGGVRMGEAMELHRGKRGRLDRIGMLGRLGMLGRHFL